MKPVYFFHDCPECHGTQKSPYVVTFPRVGAAVPEKKAINAIRYVGLEAGRHIFNMRCLACGAGYRFYYSDRATTVENLLETFLEAIGAAESRERFDRFIDDPQSLSLCSYLVL